MAERIGLAIMAYNRPHYLKRTLGSLASNDLDGVDVHLWQDGPHHPDMAPVVAESLALCESFDLPSKEVHVNRANLCCAGQRYQIMPYMAKRYNWFICADGDVVFGRWAMTHMRTLFAQFEDDDRIGTISPGFRLLCDASDVEANRGKVRKAQEHFWAEGWWAEKWATVWPWYEQYFMIVSDVPYRELGLKADEVKAWAQHIGSDILEPSSDTALLRALTMAGQARLRPVVNRATGIGENGLHSYPKIFAALDEGNQPVHEWPDEGTITQFEEVA